MKRIAILAIVIGLVVLGPAPTSVCSLLSALAGECATPATGSHCDNMDMAVPAGPTVAASSASCCAMSQAPVPESRKDAAKINLHEEFGPAPSLVVGEVCSDEAEPAEAAVV
jgi:hypothetical protein